MVNKIKMVFRFDFTILLFITVAFALLSGCKKENETVPVNETGTMTDVEGNIYKTVKIGDQWWMAENLKVKKFRNGNSINQSQAITDWTTTNSSFCLYDNNAEAPGLLYNGYAVKDTNNIAPAGWHIPSDAEWKTLEQSIGMSQSEAEKYGWRGTNEGDKLKIEATAGWTIFGNVWGNNESGFTALAGSCRLFNGTYGNPGLFATGFWWTSTFLPDSDLYYRYLDYKNSNIFRSHEAVSYGFSIRCIKD